MAMQLRRVHGPHHPWLEIGPRRAAYTHWRNPYITRWGSAAGSGTRAEGFRETDAGQSTVMLWKGDHGTIPHQRWHTVAA